MNILRFRHLEANSSIRNYGCQTDYSVLKKNPLVPKCESS
nr:MAG TPA: hypothetical protein [Caudoviricetes sp.]